MSSLNQNSKIIVRIMGGLGNQLFQYAAACRLALFNNSELVIDDITGFVRDKQYHRRYALDRFSIPARKATPEERLEPFERYRRGVMKWLSKGRPFKKKRYLEEGGTDFDRRLLVLKVNGTLYMEGYWQNENYFKDIEQIIHEHLRIIPPNDALNLRVSNEIRNSNAVVLHVRLFDKPDNNIATHNVSVGYYQRAINLMEEKIKSPHYFLFSDNPEAACAKISLPENKLTCVSHNCGDENAYADLWLMTQCQHFITSNSTFSWWGAWLGGGEEKIVVAPDLKIDNKTAWGFKGLVPSEWIKI